MSDKHLRGLEERIGYRFRDPSLLKTALTHTSFANEHKKQGIAHNERLEFLGDAVLELVSSEFLFTRYPEKKEGELSKMRASYVCEPTLAISAHELGLMSCLYLGKGEAKTGGRERDSILSDAVESVIAAIYLDGGFDEARTFILTHVLNDIERKKRFTDSKSDLQEITQAEGAAPEYVTVGETGPDHDKIFEVEVRLNGEVIGRGEGRTKKAAEQRAAFEAVRLLKDGTE